MIQQCDLCTHVKKPWRTIMGHYRSYLEIIHFKCKIFASDMETSSFTYLFYCQTCGNECCFKTFSTLLITKFWYRQWQFNFFFSYLDSNEIILYMCVHVCISIYQYFLCTFMTLLVQCFFKACLFRMGQLLVFWYLVFLRAAHPDCFTADTASPASNTPTKCEDDQMNRKLIIEAR